MNKICENVIIIFSKDRPDRLKKTLRPLTDLDYDIHLLDDSVSPNNRNVIRALCNVFGVIYHGRSEQVSVIQQFNSETIQSFVTPLGTRGWTLGYTRNYALLYSKFLGAKRVIFMDDDILTDTQTFDAIFLSLSDFSFVGVEITLMHDDSVLGHIYRASGDLLPQYVSGSCLGINLDSIQHYFLNVYNEDWIWLFLENQGQPVRKNGEVKQLKYDPFENWEDKIHFQEFGEILWSGLYYNCPPIIRQDIVGPVFWQQALRMRLQELNKMDELNIPYEMLNTSRQIQKSILIWHQTIDPIDFAKVFQKYFLYLESWQSMLLITGNIKDKN